MAVIKCKMCGGDLVIEPGSTVAECEFCGSKQTVPVADDEKKMLQFERAERLRKNCEFDKAAGLYEAIIADFHTEAEAYWGLVLCKYGIEYVDDPASGKKIPTCHRSSFDSVMDDKDFEQACENADGAARKVYRDEAKAIEEIRKGIIEVSGKEEPYDIFICYKETAESGDRTIDSVIAQDVYDALTAKGYRVFFSRITLEDKLGQEYEPYIFAALNSAKIMLAFGTDYEYYNAVWVKNEWSRYLKLMAKDKSKHLIPCYKNIDAYDMPKEFAKLQAQDMGKVGAVQDLLRGIEKILPRKAETVVQQTVVMQQGAASDTAPLLKRAFMFLEDGDWQKADNLCEQVLNQDPENAQAYLGKLMAELHVRRQEALKDCANPFDGNNNYQKAVRFADPALAEALKGYVSNIRERNEKTRLTNIYKNAVSTMENAESEDAFKSAAEAFQSIPGFKDSEKLAKECLEKAEIARKDAIYDSAKAIMNGEKNEAYKEIEACKEAIKIFQTIPGWKDADEQIVACQKKIEEILARVKENRIAAEKAAKKRNRIIGIAALAVAACAAIYCVLTMVIIPNKKYSTAVALMDAGQYEEAIAAFEAMDGYEDSSELILVCQTAMKDAAYDNAVALMNGGKYDDAISAFEAMNGYRDSIIQIAACQTAIKDNDYNAAVALMDAGEYRRAVKAFTELGNYRDAELACYYAQALEQQSTNPLAAAIAFAKAGDYADSAMRSKQLWKQYAVRDSVALHGDHILGVKKDGTVVVTNSKDVIDYGNYTNQWDVSSWRDIIAVSAGFGFALGLKSDGTVVGINGNGIYNVTGWENIVAISANEYRSVGLRSDGTVTIPVGWEDIIAISTGNDHTVGLKSDGTVVATGDNRFGQCNVSQWKDIVAISAGNECTVGLKSDGTVVAVGNNNDGRCDVSGWRRIVAIGTKHDTTVGLKSDGTVVAVGWNQYGQCNVSQWTDIVAISAGKFNTVGLKSDGTLVVAGSDYAEKHSASGWTGIKLP